MAPRPARPRRASLVAILAGALSVLAACGGQGPVTWKPDGSETAGQTYTELRKQWSRHAETYFDLEARILVDATLMAPGFAAALEKERAELEALTTAERAPRVAAAVAEAEAETVFVVSMVTNQYVWNDLDNEAGVFQARLVTSEGKVLEPLKVHRLTDREVGQLRPLFPYIPASGVVYRMRFPGLPEPRPVTLRISGTPGVAELVWELR